MTRGGTGSRASRDGGSKPRIPPGVWALGFVSLLMDASSELIHALLPLYMVGPLGASMVVVGFVEGAAEAVAMIVKVFSGYWSDRVRRRKPLILVGYGLSAVSKLVFPLAPALGWVIGGRIADRVGKGIRGAPRDALVADLTPVAVRGAAYGLRQSLDSVGAIAGPLLAIAGFAWFGGRFTEAFWIAVVPAALCIALIVVGVHERDDGSVRGGASKRIAWRDAGGLGHRFWLVTAIAVMLTFARFSEAFLVLRGQADGLGTLDAPWVMVVMSTVYAAVAWPAGRIADRGRIYALLSAGFAALIASDVVLALVAGPAGALVGAALWGLHMALTQGLLAMLVAACAPPALRGTAFGVFNLFCGVALLVASAVAGILWQIHGAGATFLTGAGLTAGAWLLLGAAYWRLPRLGAQGSKGPA